MELSPRFDLNHYWAVPHDPQNRAVEDTTARHCVQNFDPQFSQNFFPAPTTAPQLGQIWLPVTEELMTPISCRGGAMRSACANLRKITASVSSTRMRR